MNRSYKTAKGYLTKQGSSYERCGAWWNIHFDRIWTTFLIQWQEFTIGVSYNYLQVPDDSYVPPSSTIDFSLFLFQMRIQYFHHAWKRKQISND